MVTKFQRLTALLLALLTALGCFGISVSAADADTEEIKISYSSNAIATAKELQEALSYEAYTAKYSNEALYPNATEAKVIDGTAYLADGTTAKVEKTEHDGKSALETGSTGTVAYKFTLPETAKYVIRVNYWPTESESSSTSIQRILRINGKVPFSEAYTIGFTKVWKTVYAPEDENTLKDGTVRHFRRDIDNNEIRTTAVQRPEWCSLTVKDIDGFYKDPFVFVFEKGENIITLEALAEAIAIGSIELLPYEKVMSYDDYRAKFASKPKGTDIVRFEAEEPLATSTNTIYPVEDRSSAVNSPTDESRVVLNTLGGEKWQVSQQWVSYSFEVATSGMYQIVPRFRQHVNDGMYSSRALYIYSDSSLAPGADGYYNGVPFDEARELRFNYDPDWNAFPLRFGKVSVDEKGNEILDYVDCEFYFEAGVTYTIKFEVTLGTMGEIVRKVQASLDAINGAYLNIMRLTGASPDESRDYSFSTVMPDTVIQIIIQSGKIRKIADELNSLAGGKSSNIATLEKVAWLLDKMGRNPEDEFARNMKQLKSYIGNLGTWLSNAKTQPLQFDYITIQGADEKLPRGKANFFQSLKHEFLSFWHSFFRNYNRMGSMVKESELKEALQVWNAYGRDQAQVIRNLINNDFTPNTGYTVDLKLVAGGTLLPSILAGQGPDAYIGLGEDNVINYAIRGALIEIEDLAGFADLLYYKTDEKLNTVYDGNGDPIKNPDAQFNEAAMLVLGIPDAENKMHYYGLPETQAFPMMFIRSDILYELGITTLDTWDDLIEAATILSQNSMTIGLSNDYKIFLYQMGGTLFADGGMRINLDSNVALDSFETMCNMFTTYKLPYKYDFVNRFRTGEMPIGIAGYNGTYNHLIVFATELRGAWEFVPVPGYRITDPKTGKEFINNVSVSTVSAIVMINGCEDKDGTWEFMKWHVGKDCQVNYSNEMIAILGDSAKHGTANITALETMPWTNKEREALISQFQNLASIPNYPGAYIIGRYTKFSFLGAYNDGDEPVSKLLSYINIINKEITRKRAEFGLETLEVGETLASKRKDQALAEIDALDASVAASCSAEIAEIKRVLGEIEENATFKAYCDDVYIDALRKAGNDLLAKAPGNEKIESICEKISVCADSLKIYQASYPLE